MAPSVELDIYDASLALLSGDLLASMANFALGLALCASPMWSVLMIVVVVVGSAEQVMAWQSS